MLKVIKKKNSKEAAKEAAKIVVKEIKKNPRAVLGLATGKTMIPFYKFFIMLAKKEKLNLSKVKTFNLDEYFFPQKNNHPLYNFMEKNFFSKVELKKENINYLNGSTQNWKKECARYEKAIKSSGGIDLQILGIGKNGHIAFNEPGSSFKSTTRKVILSATTLKSNFPNTKKQVPKYALTVGIKTILKSKKIILLAFGKNKSHAILKTLKGKITPQVPASVLRKHRNAILVVDKKAFSK